MKDEKQPKLLGEARRHLIIKWMKETDTPLTGTELARRANVSRQVIVGDMTLLKARNEPIISTPNGYVYMSVKTKQEKITKTIKCVHNEQQVTDELFTLVDHGVTVKNVSIAHPIYGELVATIDVSTRYEVEQFIQKMKDTKGTYLSQLTNNGIHFHLIEADSEAKIQAACQELQAIGILKGIINE
ncbi:MAG: transcription repressor NadR [Bacillaceae bacterium]